MFFIIEDIINQTLLLDPKTVKRLKGLNKKHVKVEIKDLNMTLPFELFFDAKGVHISAVHSKRYDVTIQGPTTAYLCLAFTKNVHKAGKLGLTFEGDEDVGKAVQMLFTDLDIDWEELLSKVTGDTIAHKMGLFFKDIKKINQDIFKSFRENVTDYIQEEKRLIPTLLEVEYFYKDIEILRDDVERVSARIDLLEQLISKVAKARQAIAKETASKKKTSRKPTTQKTKKRNQIKKVIQRTSKKQAIQRKTKIRSTKDAPINKIKLKKQRTKENRNGIK